MRKKTAQTKTKTYKVQKLGIKRKTGEFLFIDKQGDISGFKRPVPKKRKSTSTKRKPRK